MKENQITCEKCKPISDESKLESISNKIADMKCIAEYDIMNSCMTKYKGNISSCSKEWKIFKLCHDKN